MREQTEKKVSRLSEAFAQSRRTSREGREEHLGAQVSAMRGRCFPLRLSRSIPSFSEGRFWRKASSPLVPRGIFSRVRSATLLVRLGLSLSFIDTNSRADSFPALLHSARDQNGKHPFLSKRNFHLSQPATLQLERHTLLALIAPFVSLWLLHFGPWTFTWEFGAEVNAK